MVWPSRGVGCYVSELGLEIPTDCHLLSLAFKEVLLILASDVTVSCADFSALAYSISPSIVFRNIDPAANINTYVFSRSQRGIVA